MVIAWIFNRVVKGCLAFAFLTSVFAALATDQQPPKSHLSPVPWLIILPPKIVAGAQATLAVLDSQGGLLPNITVELPGGQNVTTGPTGRALFKAPDQTGSMTAMISSRGIHASSIVVAPVDSTSSAASQSTPRGAAVISYPHVVALHDRFTLAGSGFRGAADSNHVYLNGDPCLVVASSPVSLVVLPGPRLPIGELNLHVTVAGVDAGQFPISAVLLEFTGPEETVNAGSVGRLILHAHGTTEPLVLEVRNSSPEVIQLSNGNTQRIKTSGGEDNIALVDVKFVTNGNFIVSARLISAGSRPAQKPAQ